MRIIPSADRKCLKKTAAVLAAFLLTALNFGSFFTEMRSMPEAFYAENEEALSEKLSEVYSVGGPFAAVQSSYDDRLNSTVDCRLFGLITIKSAPAYVAERRSVIPGGQAVGISIYTDGVLVVGIGSFTADDGSPSHPAQDAGIKPGDVILTVNGSPVATSDELANELKTAGAKAAITVERNGQRLSLEVCPSVSENGESRIGAWVRDSTVGIGTLTFYEMESGLITALGHAVTDADTGSLLKVKDGKLVAASIIGVTKGRQGVPGELHGTFNASSACLGTISVNTELGVAGMLEPNASALLGGISIPVAFPDEVHTGEALLITSADGKPAVYECRIVKTGKQDGPQPKGLVIEITDDVLIDITGGIVQGMSGSPIIQDGKLAGVVTHVFVNEPKRGYGAYAYWMIKRFGGG